jgi:type II secretory pathway pseudopilin PulG
MFKKIDDQQKKQAAFTFVEVLVATLLVAIVMTALGSMMALSARVAEANEMEQLAQLKAQQTMEFFRRERMVRGWNIFYSNITNPVDTTKTYCLNPLPDDINDINSTGWAGNCSNYQSDFNFFYYSVEAEIEKIDSQTLNIVINIDRFNKGASITDPVADDFFTVSQTFKQY